MLHADCLATTLAIELVRQTELLLATRNRAMLLRRLRLGGLSAGGREVPLPCHVYILVGVQTDRILTKRAKNHLHRARGRMGATVRTVGEVLLAIILLARITLEWQKVQLVTPRMT